VKLSWRKQAEQMITRARIATARPRPTPIAEPLPCRRREACHNPIPRGGGEKRVGEKKYPNPSLEALEHGGVLEHVGYDHEPDPASSDEDVLQLGDLAVLGGEGDVVELAVPVVLALDHGAAVHLAGLELHGHHVPRRLVQQLHWDTKAAAHLPPRVG
jgi:hypothetical protein